jgi:hypothetical protein
MQENLFNRAANTTTAGIIFVANQATKNIPKAYLRQTPKNRSKPYHQLFACIFYRNI